MSSPSRRPVLIPDSLSDSLSTEAVALSARRLGITAGITAAVHVVYVALYLTVWSAARTPLGLSMGLIGLAPSVVTAGYLLGGERPAARVVVVAIVYEAFLALSFSVSECWASSYSAPATQISWTAVVIVLFPFVIPARPAVVLASSSLAAAMTPLGMALVFGLSDRPWPPAAILTSYILPPFVCALLAWAPTRALAQLQQAAQRARRLGNYQLTERLGAGGMGEVWLAQHRLLARPAAVKLIKPEMLGAKDTASRELLVRRFEQEAQVTASLDSAHTVELYDFGVAPDGVLFYVMELLHGVDLESLVERFGPLPVERVVYLLLQACDSLQDAHGRGLIHRDIKPANLFVSRKGSSVDFLKVLDFGLAKRWNGDREELTQSLQQSASGLQQTGVGQIIGTPAFLAPEAVLGDQGVDQRADIYALGCVAYWLLAGRPVFQKSSTMQLLVAHMTEEPRPLSETARQQVPPALADVVMACLAKAPEARPQLASDLWRRLAEVRQGLPPEALWTEERAQLWWQEHQPAATAVLPVSLAPTQVSHARVQDASG